jgi:hypothetical protein
LKQGTVPIALLVGLSETAIGEVERTEMESHSRDRQGGYRAWFAPGTQRKTGIALIISNRLAGAKVEVHYRDPTGHTLIASLSILGRLPMLLVVSHADPSTDAARARYFEEVLAHLPPPDPQEPHRRGVWIGDFNFEEPSAEKVQQAAASVADAPDAASGRARMLAAYASVCLALGCPSGGGLEDAYAITHDGRHAVTSKAGRAIDRVLIDPRLVGGVPGLVDADTVDEHLLHVQWARKQPSDHKAVRATLRLTTVAI